MQTRIGQEYQQLTHAMGRLGLPRRPSETPNEYLERMLTTLPARSEALGVALSPAALNFSNKTIYRRMLWASPRR